MQLREELYYRMKLIREVENTIEQLFSQGLIRGTAHGSKGQEAIPAALLHHIDPEVDYICGGHRSHGHLLALSSDIRSFFAELMTKHTGLTQGKSGSQHIRYKNFFCNGITGGMVPVAVGLGFAQKYKSCSGISVVFLGDGAMNEGYVMEAFNLAASLAIPVLFVLENNSYAMSTLTDNFTSTNFQKRVDGFGIDYSYLKATNALDIYTLSKKIIADMRNNQQPHFIEFKTHRFSGHSKSDNRNYIPKKLDDYWIKNDPLTLIKNDISDNDILNIDAMIADEIQKAVSLASKDPFPERL